MRDKESRKSSFSLSRFKSQNLADWNELGWTEKFTTMRAWMLIGMIYLGVIIGICAVQGFVVSVGNEMDSIEIVMTFACDEVAQTMNEYWKNTLYLSQSTVAFFDGSNYVDREEFNTFTKGDRNDILQAIEFIPYVKDETLRTFYENEGRTMMTDLNPPGFRAIYPTWNYSIHDGAHNTIPIGYSPYFPVQYIEPLEGNEVALGYNLARDASRLTAIVSAWIQRIPVSSARITLVQSTAAQFGFRYLTPMYDDPEVSTSLLFGFISATFKIDEMLKKALSGNNRLQDIDIYLFDKSEENNFLAHYSQDTKSFEERENDFNSRKDAEMDDIIGNPYVIRKYDINVGRKWTLVCAPRQSYIESRQTNIGWYIFSIGVGLAVAQTVLRSLLIFYKRKAEKDVHSMAMKHYELEDRVKDMAHAQVYDDQIELEPQ